MPPKRRVARIDFDSDGEDDDEASVSKRSRAEVEEPGTPSTRRGAESSCSQPSSESPVSASRHSRIDVEEPGIPSTLRSAQSSCSRPSSESPVRRSSRNGRGIGGRIAQMQNLERIQAVGRPRSKRQIELDALTIDQEVNPMAPTPRINLEPHTIPCPRPRQSKPKSPQEPSAPSNETSVVRPTFALAEPGRQFGFKLPGSRFSPEDHSQGVTDPSPPPTSRASSTFSRRVSRTSTAPTSPSICSSTQDGQGLQRRRSSHLQRLALASQVGLEAPPRKSRVPRTFFNFMVIFTFIF